MGLLRKVIAKAQYELQNVVALAKYPFAGKGLIRRLENAVPALSVELTNICNANCVFCAYQYQSRPQGVMSQALFEKVVSEFSEIGGGPVNLTPTVGDPLVDRDILNRIRYARTKPNITSIGMYSNMISLERFGAEALVDSGLTSLVVSTSGLDEDMYQRVYRSREYKRMFRNVVAFAKANLKAGSPVDLFVDMRVDRGAGEVYGYADYNTLAGIIGANRIGVKWRYDNWAGKIKQEELSGNMKLRSAVTIYRPKISPCSELYSGPMVYWDGRVGACGCRDVDAQELLIGDANLSHLADIWLGSRLQQLRDEFMTHKIRGICKTCTHYNPVAVYLRSDLADAVSAIRPITRIERRGDGAAT